MSKNSIICGSIFTYWACIRLKRVRIDESFLYISNFSNEIQIPLREVTDIRENRWVNIRPITIEFNHKTNFGRCIMFMPKVRWHGLWSSHPVVGEVQQSVEKSIERELPNN